MGFKDFESFNLALLAKQWWRIIHNEELLSFKVLKGKYFHGSLPMRVQKRTNGSYLFNSLLDGKRVVENGAFWIVGDGNSIDAWNDPWLKKQPEFKATPPDQNTPTPL